jgi:hypothetical protein
VGRQRKREETAAFHETLSDPRAFTCETVAADAKAFRVAMQLKIHDAVQRVRKMSVLKGFGAMEAVVDALGGAPATDLQTLAGHAFS